MEIKRLIRLVIVLILLIGGIPLFLWKIIPKSYLGLSLTIYLILLIGCLTYYNMPKKGNKSFIKSILITFFIYCINYSFLPFIAPNISGLDFRNNYIDSVYSFPQSFNFESADNYTTAITENDFYLTQDAECKIKFPLFPIINFITVPIKESVSLFPNTMEGEFKNYEINPLIKCIYIENNKIFIELNKHSSWFIQESTIAFTYRRKVTSKLKFPMSFNLSKDDEGRFMLDVSFKNVYPFTIKNLFYIEENFAEKSTLGEFLDTTKYKRTGIFKRDISAGIAQIDKKGNLCVMGYSPVESENEMHFFMELEEISKEVAPTMQN